MNQKILKLIIGVGLTLLLIGCGTSGKASIAGKVAQNGKPVINNKVTLVMTVDGKDGETRDAQTDANGQFVFEDVQPGTYYLLTAIVTQGNSGCSTSSPGFGVLSMTTNKGIISMASNSDKPFKVKAGAGRMTKDIAFRCK
jgi:hypothetical protein